MIQKMLDTRDTYIEIIREELLGPGSEVSLPDAKHELISSTPDWRYSMGILFPHNCKMDADNDEVMSNGEESSEDVSEIEDGSSSSNMASSEKDYREEGELPIEEEAMDEKISLAAQNMPSSMGITFLASGDTTRIRCNIEFGTYRRTTAEDCRVALNLNHPERLRIPTSLTEYVYVDAEKRELRLHNGKMTWNDIKAAKRVFVPAEDDECDIFPLLSKLYDQLEKGYVREPHEAEIELDFSRGDYTDSGETAIDGTTAKLTGLRRKYNGDMWSVTLMLVNDSDAEMRGRNRKIERRHPCLFQPCITVYSDRNAFSFCEYGNALNFDRLSEKEKSLELQYRHKRVYASGLGTSAEWDINKKGCGKVFTEYFPVKEVPSMDFGVPEEFSISPQALSMKYLSDLDTSIKNEKLAHLQTVADAYKEWIDNRVAHIPNLDERFRQIAEKNMAGCAAACNRMFEGVEALREDEVAWSAFQLANRAMFMQRAHLSLQNTMSNIERFPDDEELGKVLDRIEEEGYENVDAFIKDYYSWRLFQIAFLLMSVNSVINDESPDRELVDLIWFPTGGGKTEAYLGLTAFTIFYRRLKYPDSCDGTTVIMRYTLRLLTAQQFTRASTLICACEYIRQRCLEERTYNLGRQRITIGLWIGNEHTPGKIEDAKAHVNALHKAKASELSSAKEKHNKFQVLKCPWCGSKLVKEAEGRSLKGEWGYEISNGHFRLICQNSYCHFSSDGLPIQVVDQELYTNPPTLLFGTVDKFAMLPWKPQIGAFFGIGLKNRVPELIIQDELHLISGPLGTMVGLYETIVDELCSAKGYKTKIIASTATIRRAKEQCAALYCREVAQYPHPGLDAEDSFFAREAEIDYSKGKFGRKYAGVMPSGKTKATMQIRTLAALLERMYLLDLPDEIKDQYWTLTAYFNSLKELGKCHSLLGDDVKDSIRRTAKRLGVPNKARLITTIDELTSRVSTTRLNETLDKLEKVHYSKENERNKRYASNVLIATNMISVGIDVERLNTMLMAGQPKLTSEYIQASSRVGRKYPGVVFVQYDSVRSRDRSHYEQFKSYHESYYKHVEPTGVTPYSKPARDRALHAVLIAILRILESSLSEEKNVGLFSRENYSDRIQSVKTAILERNRYITRHTAPDAEDESAIIAEELEAIIERWERFASEGENANFFYGEKFMVESPKNGEKRLLKCFNSKTCDGENPFDTMTSLRNVDGSVHGSVLIWEE